MAVKNYISVRRQIGIQTNKNNPISSMENKFRNQVIHIEFLFF